MDHAQRPSRPGSQAGSMGKVSDSTLPGSYYDFTRVPVKKAEVLFTPSAIREKAVLVPGEILPNRCRAAASPA